MSRLPPSAREIWKEFHWAFFIDTQGLILCMKRFERALNQGDLEAACVELNAASDLMEASAAAMVLAGMFTREEYETDIRVSMAPPNVSSEGFSGLMSWEHGVLVGIWRDLRSKFSSLPDVLEQPHARFCDAYRKMADGHVHVCAKFVGDEAQSLRYQDRDAIENLRRFGKSRLAMIDPPKSGKRVVT
ncbi:MAG: siderophore biosynthesis protein [Pseudomonadota bacterium]